MAYGCVLAYYSHAQNETSTAAFCISLASSSSLPDPLGPNRLILHVHKKLSIPQKKKEKVKVKDRTTA